MKLHPFDLKRRLIARNYRKKQFSKVMKSAEEYLKKKPNDIMILELLARAHISLREWEKGFSLYQTLFSLEPEYRDVCDQLVRCSIYLTNWDQLLQVYNQYPHIVHSVQIQRALEKKLQSLSEEKFTQFIDRCGDLCELLPHGVLSRWANIDFEFRSEQITPIDEICLQEKIGGIYLAIVLKQKMNHSIEDAQNLIQEFSSIYSTIEVEEWIRNEISSKESSSSIVVNWLLEMTDDTSINRLYDQFARYIPMEEFVDIENIEALALSIEVAHLWLVETLMLHKKSNSLHQLIKRNLPELSNSIEQCLLRNIKSGRREETVWLLKHIHEYPELIMVNSVRRVIAKSMLNIGAADLAYSFALNTLNHYPQDGVSAFVALNAAIELTDYDKILHAADLNFNIRSSNPHMDIASIIGACLRTKRTDLALDLMEQFRMKMDDKGHRLRIGYYFHELKDWKCTIEAAESTPEKYRMKSHLKLMEAAAHAFSGSEEKAISSCMDIDESVERSTALYAIHHIGNRKKQAFHELNNQIIEQYGLPLSKNWFNQGLNYLDLGSEPAEKYSDGPLVSVVMTVHKWNDALPLAINSILDQSHTNLEIIIVDDASPEKDVQRYQPLISDSRIKYHRMDSNQGTYACRNEGISIASGEYITFADSDDWNHPKRIEEAIHELKEKNAYMTHGRYIRMKIDGSISIDSGRPARFSLVSMFWVTEILRNKLGGFDGRVRFSADSELFERARRVFGTKKILRNSRIEVIALHHDESLTSSGDSKIDWVGPAKNRLSYVSQYRRWHDYIEKNRNARDDILIPNFLLPSELDSGLKNDFVDQLEQLFGFRVTIEIENMTKPQYVGDQITVGMATYPGGFSTLAETVASLLNQTTPISRLNIYLNGEKSPPPLPNDSRIKIIRGPNLTDIGKFSAISGHSGYILTVDDDIEYPNDYVEMMIRKIDENERKYLIGVHGAVLPIGPPITRWWDYSNLRRTHVFQSNSITDFAVNVIGTGTLGYHTDIGEIPWEQFDHHRMVDLHVAVWAQNNAIPMKIISRKRYWLTEINSQLENRIWQTANKDLDLQWAMLEVMNRCDEWKLHDKKWGIIENSCEIEWVNRELPPGLKLPKFETKFTRLGPNPKVTIYIPLFNSRDYIEETVNSALCQSYSNIEICIHDDGSTDGSYQLVQSLFGEHPNVQITSDSNHGIGFASNRAIQSGVGELVLQLDSDDIIEPETVELLVKEFHKHPEIVCSYGNFSRIDKLGEKIDSGWEHPTYSRERMMRSMIVHPPRMFRRDAYDETTGFDEELTNAVDFDFFLRLSLVGPMKHLRKSLYKYRIHESSTSQSHTAIQDRNTISIHQNILTKLGLSDMYTTQVTNPKFPRRISYILRWQSEYSEQDLDAPHQDEIQSSVIETKSELNAIEVSNVELYFPQTKNLASGLLNLLRRNDKFATNQFKALDNVSLEVKQGEVLGIIGRNGSGKSTIVRAMSGIYRPDVGQIRVRGRSTLLAGVSVGLNPNLNGRENVHLYGSILGHNRETMDEMMEKIIDFSEIGEFIEQPLRTYSAGMRARLGFAIASAIQPEVLLIDEVLGVGDQQFKKKSKQRILELVEATGTVVIVSHSFGLMEEICDRIALIHKGRLADIGDPKKVIATYHKITN